MKYPIDIQNFGEIRRDGYVYVDKTTLMQKLIGEEKCCFLSRSRRFGKFLLLSTLEANIRRGVKTSSRFQMMFL